MEQEKKAFVYVTGKVFTDPSVWGQTGVCPLLLAGTQSYTGFFLLQSPEAASVFAQISKEPLSLLFFFFLNVAYRLVNSTLQ